MHAPFFLLRSVGGPAARRSAGRGHFVRVVSRLGRAGRVALISWPMLARLGLVWFDQCAFTSTRSAVSSGNASCWGFTTRK
jgi:hypothetical protein